MSEKPFDGHWNSDSYDSPLAKWEGEPVLTTNKTLLNIKNEWFLEGIETGRQEQRMATAKFLQEEFAPYTRVRISVEDLINLVLRSGNEQDE